MAPYRNSRTGNQRRVTTQPDHDVFEGLPVRHWRKRPINVNTNVEKSDAETLNILPSGYEELPMPKDANLLSETCYAILRAARMGLTKRDAQDGTDDGKKQKDSRNESLEDQSGLLTKKWSLVPREMEGPEPEFLAKRRKGLPSLYGVTPAPRTSAGHMRKTKIRKLGTDGKNLVWEVLVPEGQTIDGEIAEDETSPTEAPLPGTIVEGLGVANAEGVVIAGDQSLNTPPRRKPPPPKKKSKGRSSRDKKKVAFAPGVPGQAGVDGTNNEASGMNVEGGIENGLQTASDAGQGGDVAMSGAGLEGEDGSDEGSEAEDGEDTDKPENKASEIPDASVGATDQGHSDTKIPSLDPSGNGISASTNFVPSNSIPNLPSINIIGEQSTMADERTTILDPGLSERTDRMDESADGTPAEPTPNITPEIDSTEIQKLGVEDIPTPMDLGVQASVSENQPLLETAVPLSTRDDESVRLEPKPQEDLVEPSAAPLADVDMVQVENITPSSPLPVDTEAPVVSLSPALEPGQQCTTLTSQEPSIVQHSAAPNSENMVDSIPQGPQDGQAIISESNLFLPGEFPQPIRLQETSTEGFSQPENIPKAKSPSPTLNPPAGTQESIHLSPPQPQANSLQHQGTPNAPTPSPPTPTPAIPPFEQKHRLMDSPKAPTMSPPTPARARSDSPDIPPLSGLDIPIPPLHNVPDPISSATTQALPPLPGLGSSIQEPSAQSSSASAAPDAIATEIPPIDVQAAPPISQPHFEAEIPHKHNPLDGLAAPELQQETFPPTQSAEQSTGSPAPPATAGTVNKGEGEDQPAEPEDAGDDLLSKFEKSLPRAAAAADAADAAYHESKEEKKEADLKHVM